VPLFAVLLVPSAVDCVDFVVLDEPLEPAEPCEPLDGVVEGVCCASSGTTAKHPRRKTIAIGLVDLVMKLVSHCRDVSQNAAAPTCNQIEIFGLSLDLRYCFTVRSAVGKNCGALRTFVSCSNP
jgi:hypothetical protein